MQKLILLSLLFGLLMAESTDFNRLKSYDCNTQNIDFQNRALLVISNSENYDKDEMKILYGSYYKSKNDGFSVKKWCETFKSFHKSNYETYKALFYFKELK